jgi:hypothetical protein
MKVVTFLLRKNNFFTPRNLPPTYNTTYDTIYYTIKLIMR